MRARRIASSVLGLAMMTAVQAGSAEIVFENPRLRAVCGEDAVWRSLTDKATGRECVVSQARVPLATVRVADATHAANRVWRDGVRLGVEFAGCDTRLVYAVEPADDWLVFRLVEIGGTRPTHATLLQLPAAITARGGSRLNAAWDETYAVCLRGLNLQSQGVLARRRDHCLLSVLSQDEPGPRLEGAGAVLIGAPTPELKPILNRWSIVGDLPRNADGDTASHDLPIARLSYWFLRFGERDVDRVIDECRRTGIRVVMLDSGCWCASVGHFTFNHQLYPDGLDSLRRAVARLHEQGILVGMHTFASKVSKTDPYVAAAPGRGFCVDARASLAEAVAADATRIRTASDLSQWPGSPVCRQKVWEGHVSKHQEVVIDDEIIRYETIGPEGRWDTFLGCQRGAWGTRPATHAAAAECRHNAVDGCINGYILDQESPLFQETTDRLAAVFNACDFDMVYFDGSEDVDRRRYDYYASLAHATAMGKFTKRPLIHKGGGFHHGLWHSFTSSATVDQYPGTYLAYEHAGGTIANWPTCKDHIDRSVRLVQACEDEMTPGELGWFGIGPRLGRYDGLQFDEIEYLMGKSLAYNAPISLQTSFARMDAHPLTPDILEIVRQYEALRAAGTVPIDVRQTLGKTGQDFILLPDRLRASDAAATFAAVAPLESLAGGRDLRALCGDWDGGAVASLWHFVGKPGTLILPSVRLDVYDVHGRPVEIVRASGQIRVSVDQRRLVLHFLDIDAAAARRLLSAAQFEPRPPTVIWIRAADYAQQAGEMVRGSATDIADPAAAGDVVLCRGAIDRTGASYVEYRATIPRAGRWTLWARVRYPTGGDMSFGIAHVGDRVTLSGDQVLGNCGVNDAQWHWTGRGGGLTTPPPGEPIVFRLEAGEFAFRIYPREGPGRTVGNPRLDCLCLVDEPDYRPSDAEMRAALADK